MVNETLGDAYPKRQADVRRLRDAYREIGPAGAFGLAVIDDVLRRADEAVASGDVVAMLRLYQEMGGLK